MVEVAEIRVVSCFPQKMDLYCICSWANDNRFRLYRYTIRELII